MTSLSGLLSIGRSSLIAHQAAMGVASGNTANADTVGYARRDITLKSAPGGSGVSIGSVLRRSMPMLEQRVFLARGRLGAHQAKADGLAAIERNVGDEGWGLGTRLDALFASLRTLATDPADNQLRADTVGRGEALASAFSGAALTISNQRSQADAALIVSVARVSELTDAIARQNDLVVSEAPGTEAQANAQDERQRLIGELSEQLDVHTYEESDGSITILLQGGLALVSGGTAASLTATADPSLGGLRRIDLVDASGSTLNVTDSVRGGNVGGLLELRDEILVDAGDRLDQLAYDIATNFNATHSAGYGTDGATGRDFFDPPGTVAGSARNMALATGLRDNPSWIAAANSGATADGGNDNILSLINLADSSLAAGGTSTFGEEMAGMVGDIGRATRAEQDASNDAQDLLDQSEALHQAATGVSIDEELIDITRFERAYQAGARIIQSVDQMYQTILQL